MIKTDPAPFDAPGAGVLEAIFTALDMSSADLVGSARPRLLVIPIRDDSGVVAGGLWAATIFQWLQVQMLFVPPALRGRGVGSTLIGIAEAEARTRGCRAVTVDTFSFQAGPFYEKLGFTLFGRLHDFPRGHDRLYFRKTLDGAARPPRIALRIAH